MDLGVVGTLYLFIFLLLQICLFLESNNVSDMNMFGFLPPIYAPQTFSQSYQRSCDLIHFENFANL